MQSSQKNKQIQSNALSSQAYLSYEVCSDYSIKILHNTISNITEQMYNVCAVNAPCHSTKPGLETTGNSNDNYHFSLKLHKENWIHFCLIVKATALRLVAITLVLVSGLL